MGDEDLIEKWYSNTPGDESADTVERLLVKYFGRSSVSRKRGGSHQLRIKHQGLADLPGFGIGGHLSIPIKGGSRVKKLYLKRIAQAIKRLAEVADAKNMK